MIRVCASVILDWTFTPPNYFEEEITISRPQYTMTIGDGTAQAQIDSVVFDANPSLQEELHCDLLSRFAGIQLLTHRPYELSNPTVSRVHPDGRRDVFVQAQTAIHAVSGMTADIQLVGKEGNIVSDSKRDRVETKKRLAELIATNRPTDRLLDALLRSHDAAVRDPGNELVHLYEIRDALSKKFGGEKAARAALSIRSSDWSRFGRICNDEPLRQGRHRGKTGPALRDATKAELEEARRIARDMIVAYLGQ